MAPGITAGPRPSSRWPRRPGGRARCLAPAAAPPPGPGRRNTGPRRGRHGTPRRVWGLRDPGYRTARNPGYRTARTCRARGTAMPHRGGPGHRSVTSRWLPGGRRQATGGISGTGVPAGA